MPIAPTLNDRFGSWLRENSEIEFANGNFVSTSINLKNKSAGDGCRDKTIEKTILRAFRARTFSRSLGQNRKSSMRANVFRCSPNNGHRQETSACPFRAMCGRLRVGKSFLHVLQHWSVQPCVRPVDAVHMTAGHNALPGSGPGHKPAFDTALPQVGCPDRRIYRLCITCCSPSQPSHHAA